MTAWHGVWGAESLGWKAVEAYTVVRGSHLCISCLSQLPSFGVLAECPLLIWGLELELLVCRANLQIYRSLLLGFENSHLSSAAHFLLKLGNGSMYPWSSRKVSLFFRRFWRSGIPAVCLSFVQASTAARDECYLNYLSWSKMFCDNPRQLKIPFREQPKRKHSVNAPAEATQLGNMCKLTQRFRLEYIRSSEILRPKHTVLSDIFKYVFTKTNFDYLESEV